MQGKPYFRILFKRPDGTGVELVWQKPDDMIDIFILPNKGDRLDGLVSSYSPNLFDEALEEFDDRVKGKIWGYWND